MTYSVDGQEHVAQVTKVSSGFHFDRLVTSRREFTDITIETTSIVSASGRDSLLYQSPVGHGYISLHDLAEPFQKLLFGDREDHTSVFTSFDAGGSSVPSALLERMQKDGHTAISSIAALPDWCIGTYRRFGGGVKKITVAADSIKHGSEPWLLIVAARGTRDDDKRTSIYAFAIDADAMFVFHEGSRVLLTESKNAGDGGWIKE